MTYNAHEIEEAEFGRDGGLWDADPDVCCAAFQLGACEHTESYDEDPDDELDWWDVHEDEVMEERAIRGER